MTVESGGLGCCPLCVHGGAQESKPCNRFRYNFVCWEYVPDLLKNYGMELDLYPAQMKIRFEKEAD